jgi:hypothetical protein
MVLANATGFVGQMLGTATASITGSLFLSLFMMFIILLAICFMFGIPLEFSGIILLPLCLVLMTYYSEFIGTGGVMLIYLAFVIAKNMPFR